MGYLIFIKDAIWFWGGGDEFLGYVDIVVGVRYVFYIYVVVFILG